MEDIKVLYDLLKEMREDQKEHGKELAAQSNMLIAIQKDVEVNTKDLTEHKEGVIQNRKGLREVREEIGEIRETYDKKIIELEQPKKFQGWLYNKYVKILTITSIVVGIAGGITRLLGLW